MSRDRFIWFETKSVPTKDQITNLVNGYLSHGLMDKCGWKYSRMWIDLTGLDQMSKGWTGNPRSIEIYVADNNVDVITRMADDVTNDIADGLANLIERKFNGKKEKF